MVSCGDLSQKFKVARFRQIEPGVARDWLDNDAGDLFGISRESCFDRILIIKGQDNCMLSESGGDTGAVRIAEGERARSGLDEQRIGMAVIAAIEFDDLIALGEATSQTDRGHACLGSRVS